MKLALVAMLSLVACSGNPAPALHVSRSFTAPQQAEILAAAAKWNWALGPVFEPSTSDCPEQGVCIAPAMGPLGDLVLGTTAITQDVTKIWLALDVDAAYEIPVGFVALHELGHALGLMHHPAGTAMAACAQNQADHVTADDVAQWEGLQQ